MKLLIVAIASIRVACFDGGVCCTLTDKWNCDPTEIVSAPSVSCPTAIVPSDIYAVNENAKIYEKERKFRFEYPGIWYPTFDHVAVSEGKI